MTRSLTLLFALTLLVPTLAQEKPPAPPKKVVTEKDHVEDGLGRILRRAQHCEGGHLCEGIVIPNCEGDAYLVILKISDGSLVVAQGGAEKSEDMWIAVEKSNGDLLEAAVRRLKAN